MVENLQGRRRAIAASGDPRRHPALCRRVLRRQVDQPGSRSRCGKFRGASLEDLEGIYEQAGDRTARVFLVASSGHPPDRLISLASAFKLSGQAIPGGVARWADPKPSPRSTGGVLFSATRTSRCRSARSSRLGAGAAARRWLSASRGTDRSAHRDRRRDYSDHSAGGAFWLMLRNAGVGDAIKTAAPG